ncbi:MAG: preprotein translocase subunit SecE [Candidatus Dadabacteria bacterium]|nr:preprotein translocase subunit SecE [Candidatus Dadabacteria bacterium]
MERINQLIANTAQFVKDVDVEIKRISWPSLKESIRSTGAVIVITIILASFLGAIDFLFSLVVKHVLS